MSIIVTVSSMIIPAIMLFIVGYGMIKRKNVYDDFVMVQRMVLQR